MRKDRQYASNELVYVCRRKIYHLSIGTLLCSLVALFIYSVVSIPIDQNFADIALVVGLSSPFWGFGAYLILSFLRSRRIEFYGDYARVQAGGTTGTFEVSYSEIELGDLKLTSTSRYGTSGYTHFKLRFAKKKDSNDSMEKKFAFDVYNGKTIESDYTIYYWIRDRLIDLSMWHESLEPEQVKRMHGSAYSRVFGDTLILSVVFFAIFLVLLYFDLTVPFSSSSASRGALEYTF